MSDSERVWQKFSKFSLASNNSGVLGVFRVRTKLLSHNFNTCETTFVAILQSVSLACNYKLTFAEQMRFLTRFFPPDRFLADSLFTVRLCNGLKAEPTRRSLYPFQ